MYDEINSIKLTVSSRNTFFKKIFQPSLNLLTAYSKQVKNRVAANIEADKKQLIADFVEY